MESVNAEKGASRSAIRPVLRLSSVLLIGAALTPMAFGQLPATKPVIKTISKITTQKLQTITITGTGFGTHAPYTGDSDFISFLDTTKKWQAGYEGCLLGFCTTDTVTLIVHSWTNTKIVVGGFSGAWGTHNFTLAKGNSEQISIFNPQTSAGPATRTVKVVAAATTTTLTSSAGLANEGDAVEFVAVVDSDAGPPPDGEIVKFMQGETVLGIGRLAGGSARFSTSTLERGTGEITAVYEGDADFDASASKALEQVVQ
jgi:hypothetical protein